MGWGFVLVWDGSEVCRRRRIGVRLYWDCWLLALRIYVYSHNIHSKSLEYTKRRKKRAVKKKSGDEMTRGSGCIVCENRKKPNAILCT